MEQWLRRRWAELNHWPQTIFDLTVAVSVATVTVNDAGDWPLDVPFGLAMAAALVVRRHRPIEVFMLCLGLAATQTLFGGSGVRAHDIAVLVAMVAVVTHASRLRYAYLAGAGVLAGLMFVTVRYRGEWSDNVLIVLAYTFCAAVWLMAYALRTRHDLVEYLRERAQIAERERDHVNALALAKERADIARELHDVVAHSLAVMVVQADGARYAMQNDPARADSTLATIADVGREALDDMHRIVDVLRGSETGPAHESDPVQGGDRRRVSLERLGSIGQQARAAGLHLELDIEPSPYRLSGTEELTLVRLVQEALTNVLRHAGPGTNTKVRLCFGDVQALLDVIDHGNGTGPVSTSAVDALRSGSGLVGMRERVSSHGGTFAAGPRDEGGWAISAAIPVKAAQAMRAGRKEMN